MKYFYLFILCYCSFMCYAQTHISREHITIKSTLRGEKLDAPQPSPLSSIFKFRLLPLSQDLDWAIYMTEYRFGKKIPYILERLEYRRVGKGNRLTWEIIPDITDIECLHVYMNIPGVTNHREKKVAPGKTLRYNIYQSAGEIIDKPTPLLLIYEDDFTDKNLKIVERYTTQDSLRINSTDSLLKEVDHCYLIYYQLSKHQE